MSAARKRGRPPKPRPALGSELVPGMSLPDIAAATGIPLRRLRRAHAIAELPEAEFEAALARREVASPAKLDFLHRSRNGKATEYTRCCPHCGKPLRIEDAR